MPFNSATWGDKYHVTLAHPHGDRSEGMFSKNQHVFEMSCIFKFHITYAGPLASGGLLDPELLVPTVVPDYQSLVWELL